MILHPLELDRFLTDFGDGAVQLPIVGVSIILFAAFGWMRGAIIWGAISGTALAVLMLAKLAGLEWAYLSDSLGRPLSVSGHVSAGTAIYGSLINILIFRKKRLFPFYLPVPVVIAYMFSYTRLVLHSHTLPEVLLGGALGISVAVASTCLLVPMPRRVILPTFAVLTIVIFSFYGYHSDTEIMLQTDFSKWAPSF